MRSATAEQSGDSAGIALASSGAGMTAVGGGLAFLNQGDASAATRAPGDWATVELKVHPGTVRGEQGVDARVGLMRGFVTLGGMFLHIDVVNSARLLDAQRHPEKYPTYR